MAIDMSLSDAKRDYVGVVMMHKGVPVLVSGIDDDFQVTIVSLRSGKSKIVSKEVLFAMTPPPRLGMVNTPDRNAVFVVRLPHRRYQMGVSSNNLLSIQIGNSDMPRSVGSSGFYRTKEFADTITGTYPKFYAALLMAREKNIIVAFDRQFALSSSTLYYKDKAVGRINNTVQSFSDVLFHDKYKFTKKLYLGA